MKKHNVINIISVAVIIAVLVLFYMFSPAFRDILSDYGFPDVFKQPVTYSLYDTAAIHIIDVGQGDSILLQNKSTNVLIDTGPNSAEDSLVSYLNSLGIERLDCLILTHPHEDHMGSADTIVNVFEVDTVLMPDCTSSSKFFENFLDAAEDNNIGIVIPERGDSFVLDGLEFTVLAPGAGPYGEVNDYSIVLKVTYKNTSFMFTGDAEAISEEEILENFDAHFLDCDFLKAGHHGSTTSNTREFVLTVSPEYAAFSCGYENSYGHPHREIRELFDELGIEYSRTDLDGNVVYISDGEKITGHL